MSDDRWRTVSRSPKYSAFPDLWFSAAGSPPVRARWLLFVSLGAGACATSPPGIRTIATRNALFPPPERGASIYVIEDSAASDSSDFRLPERAREQLRNRGYVVPAPGPAGELEADYILTVAHGRGDPRTEVSTEWVTRPSSEFNPRVGRIPSTERVEVEHRELLFDVRVDVRLFVGERWRDNRRNIEMWRGLTSAPGPREDMAELLDCMLRATLDRLGEESRGKAVRTVCGEAGT